MGVHKTSYAAVRDEPLYKDLHPSNIDHYVRQYKGNPQVMARLRQKGKEKAAERAEEDARVAKEQAKAAAQRKAGGAPDASSSSSSSPCLPRYEKHTTSTDGIARLSRNNITITWIPEKHQRQNATTAVAAVRPQHVER